jgi:hypothetical protein
MKRIEQIAKVCHEANKAYCEAIGDKSQVSWHAAPDWQKESVINGVEFHMNNPKSTPEDSHNNWLEKKKAEGWKKGKKKDPVKRTHPLMVPFQMLPKEQKAKDYIFLGIVRAMLNPNF